jgi:crotonobetainyl-CoA:carnitine CoA-transferase CaiB-like acyl-CoA transferase
MKLEGLRVVDLSLFLPGPHLSMMMSDHGADVIAVEPPDGEPNRQIGLVANGHSVWFRNTHRGKKSVCLNLKDAADRSALLELCRTADVVIEAFRPGIVERLGVDYKAVSAINPAVVYCSISAFGQTGPKRDQPSHDLSVQADSGVVSLNLGSNGEPAMPAIPSADMAASLMALSGILMALYRRSATGRGDFLDISMQDCLVSWLPNAMGPTFAEKRPPDVQQERSWGGSAMYRIYRTRDGRFLTLGGSEPKFAANLLRALGRDDLLEFALQAPGAVHDPVKRFLEQTFASRDLADWNDWFSDKDICYSPVRNLVEAIEEPHLLEREMILKDPMGNPHLGVPIKFSDEPARPRFDLPAKGEHNASVSGRPAVQQR